MKYLKIIVINGLVLLAILGCLEMALRYQTKSELQYQPRPFKKFSHYVHHYPALDKGEDSQRDDYAVTTTFGQCGPTSRKITVLYLGDSWMAEGNIASTISSNLHKDLPAGSTCIVSVNAGVGSYSPSVYLIKAKIMMRSIQPDFVLINIDETDLMDESIFYRDSAIRDENGHLIALTGLQVATIEKIEEKYKRRLNDTSSYLVRLLKREILRGFVNDLMHSAYDVEKTFESRMGPQLSKTPSKDYADEIAYFRQQTEEMIEGIIGNGISRDRIFITTHPHYLHIREENGMRYNDIVARTLTEVTGKTGVRFYNAMDNFAKIHGTNIEGVFRWPEDKWSHPTTKGYVQYGQAIYDAFSKDLNNLAKP